MWLNMYRKTAVIRPYVLISVGIDVAVDAGAELREHDRLALLAPAPVATQLPKDVLRVAGSSQPQHYSLHASLDY